MSRLPLLPALLALLSVLSSVVSAAAEPTKADHDPPKAEAAKPSAPSAPPKAERSVEAPAPVVTPRRAADATARESRETPQIASVAAPSARGLEVATTLLPSPVATPTFELDIHRDTPLRRLRQTTTIPVVKEGPIQRVPLLLKPHAALTVPTTIRALPSSRSPDIFEDYASDYDGDLLPTPLTNWVWAFSLVKIPDGVDRNALKRITVELFVDDTGAVQDVLVLQSSGVRAVDNSVVKAMYRMIFQAPVFRGYARASVCTHSFMF